MSIQRITPIIAAVSVAIMLMFMIPPPAEAMSRSDEAITAEVQQALDDLGNTIRVRTENGKVYLRGNVVYMEDAIDAEWKARRVDGVRSVNTDIDYLYSNISSGS